MVHAAAQQLLEALVHDADSALRLIVRRCHRSFSSAQEGMDRALVHALWTGHDLSDIPDWRDILLDLATLFFLDLVQCLFQRFEDLGIFLFIRKIVVESVRVGIEEIELLERIVFVLCHFFREVRFRQGKVGAVIDFPLIELAGIPPHNAPEEQEVCRSGIRLLRCP